MLGEITQEEQRANQGLLWYIGAYLVARVRKRTHLFETRGGTSRLKLITAMQEESTLDHGLAETERNSQSKFPSREKQFASDIQREKCRSLSYADCDINASLVPPVFY